MKKIYILSLLFAASFDQVSAQTLASDRAGNLRDMHGNPVMTKDYSDTKGTPYFLDNWTKGTVKLNGSTVRDIDLKFNLVEQQLVFRDPDSGTPLGFKDDVREFSFVVKEAPEETLLFRNGYPPSSNTYFQVLADGAVQLLKKQSKVVKETREFNSASTVKSFDIVTDYYLVKGGQLIRIKKNLKDVLSNLENSSGLTEFLRANDLDGKKEGDLAKLISHYNTLRQ